MNILYRKNKLGVGSWRIWNEANIIYIAHSTTNGGAEVIHTEEVPNGLAGRSLQEQIDSRIRSRINHQKDKGYVESIEVAIFQPLSNTLGLPPPMLAKKLDQLKDWRNFVMQPKLDGFRCLVARDGNDITIYSRQGKVLDALSHLKELLANKIPDGMILDGEIYKHGIPLQAIASLAKRKQTGTESLVYNVYDSVSKYNFSDRYAEARDVVFSLNSPQVIILPNIPISTKEEMWAGFEIFRSNGFEGGMLRNPDMPYESGTRSSGLIKVKAREDEEFEVTDVTPDENGNGVLWCKTKEGKIFRTSAPGTHDQKKFILVHKDQYIGRMVTCEFANYTNDKIPFHCVAIRFRPLDL